MWPEPPILELERLISATTYLGPLDQRDHGGEMFPDTGMRPAFSRISWMSVVVVVFPFEPVMAMWVPSEEPRPQFPRHLFP